MIGELKSVQHGPERNVELVITYDELRSELYGRIDPASVDHYEIVGLQEHDRGLVSLTLVMADGRRVPFYCTESKLDMMLLLDQLDGTNGQRRRESSTC